MSITDKISTLPTQPGVYLFQGRQGKILYVGKAKHLRQRVRSYFTQVGKKPGPLTPSVRLDSAKQAMVRQITDIDTITCDTVIEALVLEANLIKKHQPPYNVILRDDKFYLFIKITTNEAWPRVFPVRKIKPDKARYFGPYSSAVSVRATLKLLRRIFPYRGEKDTPREQIFSHPLFRPSTNAADVLLDNTSAALSTNTSHRPPPLAQASLAEVREETTPPPGGEAPTERLPTKALVKAGAADVASADGRWQNQYQQNIKNVIRFLQGRRLDIINTLKQGMAAAAKEHHFEQAAIWRDQLRAIERLEGSQKVYLPRRESFDAISIVRQKNHSAANIFSVREGKLLNKNAFLLQHRATTASVDILRQFILQYYQVAQDKPPAIMTPWALSDEPAIASWINHSHPPIFFQPRRGQKRQLIKMGELNAQQLLRQKAAASATSASIKQALAELAHLVGEYAPKPLHRIETYDISNLQGKMAVGSMVVFTDGQPDKQQYKKFKIQSGNTPNDLAMLREVLTRRFSDRHSDWPPPNLLLIDGGRGQLNVAQRILQAKKLTISLAALAKREEELFTPNRSEPIRLPFDSPALFLLQRLRDEAHRFSLAYHRLLRQKQQRRSLLDEIPGLGPKTKQKLLYHFGSLRAIKQASSAELVQLIGPAKTTLLRDWL